ncbi:MAG: imidazole glycerol phosphate synthase subunit HisH [Lachnospiraceae bacterium]|nr:imidazole glycerol phosphate synthase subunit HisH [Lachnospiraceae bacterium]
MVAVIDYDAGNIMSVCKAVEYLGEEVKLTSDYDEIMNADKVILPGVGSFGDAMEKLRARKLDIAIKDVVKKGTPFLGICLGLQLLFKYSDESPDAVGLDIIPGRVVRIPDKEGLKIPHMGWNSLKIMPDKKLFKGIDGEPFVYFVHSYYLEAEDKADVAATTEYSTLIHASVEHDNVFACQFHPEKSGEIGLKILDNFLKL